MTKKHENITYKTFAQLLPHVRQDVHDELMAKLRKQPRPSRLCGKDIPESLNALTYGTLDDIRSASKARDVVGELAKILLDADPSQLLNEDVNDVFGFLNFVQREVERINKLFSDIKTTYSGEEERAGVHELDFGSFGVLDWYARRMGITNQNEVRGVAWVRIYQCMKNDNMQSEYERRLQKQYTKKVK